MIRQKNRYLKMISTGIGALGGLATAAFGVTLGGGLTGAQHRTDPAEMTTGATVTETTVPKAPETSKAEQAVSATTPSGFATPH